MEVKDMSSLLIHQLREKRNWAVLTGVILLITVLIVPMLMESDIEEGHIMIGIFEVFIIVFMNTLLDFNYLHDTRKFSYYTSKPLLDRKRIDIVLTANVMFASLFMIILWFIAAFVQMELLRMFLMPVSFLVIIIFLTGLSSLLSGHTIVAAIATWFNFGLPFFILGVCYFVLDIVSDMAVGINTSSIMEYFVENIYRIDIIYFYKYVHDMSWIAYFITLIAILGFIYGLIQVMLRRRQSERIGEFIVFDGYKYFVALLLSTLITYLFTLILSDNDFIAKIIAFIILGSITYYVVLVILEKTFKHKNSVYKLLAIFLIIFIVGVSISGMIVKQVEKIIPEVSEIRGVLISQSTYLYLEDLEKSLVVSDIEWHHRESPNINIYSSSEAINLLRNLHIELVDDNRYNMQISFNMVYFLENGRKVTRYFETRIDKEPNQNLDKIANDYKSLDEYKLTIFPILYKDLKEDVNLEIYNETSHVIELDSQAFIEIREALKEDIDVMDDQNYGQLSALLNTYGNYSVFRDYSYAIATKEVDYDYRYIRLYNNEYNQGFDIPRDFVNTRIILEKYYEE